MIISAFTIGASFHIVVTQITTLLGLKKFALTTPFAIAEVILCSYSKIPHKFQTQINSTFQELIEIFSHIAKTNLATLIISIVSMVFIFSIKHFINEKYKEKMFAPIPVDLIVVLK
jgi:MFS superfamily sulfate permease-like transporter